MLIIEALFGDADEVTEMLHAAGCHIIRYHNRAGICRALAPGRAVHWTTATRAPMP